MSSLSCLSSLEKKSLLRDNVDLLVSLADVYFRAGDTKNAILKFEQAQMLDPYLIKGVLQHKSIIVLYLLKHLSAMFTCIVQLNSDFIFVLNSHKHQCCASLHTRLSLSKT